ncbi:type II toxin-antitoxin system prevent-host-death family antitoxin [Streptomyces sp. AC555_RSS877]|uniref:type II toxin-antitoxin system prevent-host-death family antitoxin n=1 Tax=Streptomyces sp. AC555_RSS877 TaxID=2823688 RepID=UPI001C27942F|nr:type II toxin-antitoxin system prevent-host-death family antitoxin [Streptomyces sp. AC555_RSS877]
MWLDDKRTALYRLYDAGGQLLYIGISYQPEVRFEQHSEQKSWWPEVARRDIQWFDDRPAAAIAETLAIRTEDPEYNGTSSPRRKRCTIRDGEAGDGVHEVSLSLARGKLTSLVESVTNGGPAVAFLNYGRRDAYLVSIDEYRRMEEDIRIADVLRRLPQVLSGEGESDAARVLREALDIAKRRALDST